MGRADNDLSLQRREGAAGAHGQAGDAPPSAAPNCWKCRHFFMTWAPATPYVCRLLGFRSKALPSAEVVRADGRACRGFSSKSPAPSR